MKKLISVLLAVIIIMTVFCTTPAFAASDSDFIPIIRFIASSDTHIQDDNDTNALRIEKMLEIGYTLAEEDENYNKLDAVLIAGDLTNDGTKSEFDKFWNAVSNSMHDGTRFLGVVAKSHDGFGMSRKKMRNYYEALTGNTPDFHTVINGYHFIGVSVSEKKSKHYDSKQLEWLKNELDEAVAQDPDKPIFVMHHEHVINTVYGSSDFDGWGVKYFTEILNQYPQVVDFSGHSHYPLNDPRSIWQGQYTAIGTGAIRYSEFTVDDTRVYHPDDSYDTATCWIVELDAANRIRLRGMDVNEAKLLCEYIIENPADPANRDYTPDVRKDASDSPVFAEDAAITVTSSNGECTISVPAAISTDGMPIVLYRAYAQNSRGSTVEETWTLPQYYRAIEQNEISLTLEALGEGEYTVFVVAENAYGKQSQPIKTTVTVEGKSAFATFFDRIGLFFKRAWNFIKSLF